MKFSLILAVLSFAMVTFASEAKIIYGEDNRLDVRDVQDAALLEVAASTAVLIPQWKLDIFMNPASDAIVRDAFNLNQAKNVCIEERFATQPALGGCSGFLVGEKTLVTAGHCVSETSCDGKVWAFDYKLDTEGVETVDILPENVYSCARVIRSVLDLRTKLDYAVVELDRPVTGRKPLKFRKKGKIQLGTSIVVIGHPSGVPTKITGGARVMRTTNLYFGANLDTYGGNSGSAVFNAKTLEVEGVLVRGDLDYNYTDRGCKVSNVVEKDKGSEEVTRITKVKEIQ